MYLLEKPDKSERYVGKSLEGREDWTILGEVDRLPEDIEDWDPKTKKWKINQERKTKKDRKNKYSNLEELLSRVEALEIEVEKLKGAK